MANDEMINVQIPATVNYANPAVPAQKEVTLIDTTKFSEGELQKAAKEANTLDFADTNALIMFGGQAQRDLNSFLDTLLGGLKAKDAGLAGDYTIALAKGLELANIKKIQDHIAKGKSLFAKLFNPFKVFFARQQEITGLLDDLIQRYQQDKIGLIESNAKFDALVKQNDIFQDQMAVAIVAGDMAATRMDGEYKTLVARAEESKDMQDASEASDFKGRMDQFAVRVLDMKIAYFEAMSSTPQIRAAQEAIKIELQNLERVMLNEMPLLKKAIINLANLYNIQKAQGDSKKTTDARRALQEAAVDATGQALMAAKESQGQALLDEVNHMVTLSEKMMGYLEEAKAKEKENELIRAEATQKLAQAKKTMAEKMTALA